MISFRRQTVRCHGKDIPTDEQTAETDTLWLAIRAVIFLFVLILISVILTNLCVSLVKLTDKCSEWYIVVAWVAANVAEPTQSTTRQPALVVTTNVSTLWQSCLIKTALQRIIDQRLIRRTSHCAYNTHSSGTANASVFTILHRALWQKITTLNYHISDSLFMSMAVVWTYHIIWHNLCCEYSITATVTSGLHLNQLQILLQQQVSTSLLFRQKKVNMEWLHGSCD